MELAVERKKPRGFHGENLSAEHFYLWRENSQLVSFLILRELRRKPHSILRIHHAVLYPMVIQDGLGDIKPQAAAAAVPVS